MKKLYFLAAFCGLFNLSVRAQVSGCASAVDLNIAFQLSTQSWPVDPAINYGCVPTGQNYYYGYFKVCQAGTVSLYASTSSGSGSDADIVVWGPFSTMTNICSNLTAGNIAGCAATSYVVDSVALGTVNAGDIYMVAVAVDSSWGQGYISRVGTATIDFTCSSMMGNCYPSAGFETPCLVTVDSLTQKYKITWEKLPPNPVSYFEIYRYGITGMTLIDTVNYSSLSEYIDMGSNPNAVVERYEIATRDTCGSGWASTGSFVQAAFCQSSVSTQNTVNVSWSPYYGPTLASYYVVYRGATPTTMVPIDSVPDFVNMYTDVNPLSGTSYYKIGVGLLGTCVASRMSSPIVQSWSNNTSVTVVGLEEIGVLRADIFPNPSNGLLTITGLTEQTTVSVVDVSGRIVAGSTLQASETNVLDLQSLESGMYFVLLENEKGMLKKAVTIQR